LATVLYIDDEEGIRRAVKSWLVRRGHTALTAGSGEEARAMLAAHPVDGVFIDVWLGAESGFELFKWIVEHHPRLAERAAFVTGDLARDAELDHVSGGFGCPVVSKPFEFAELERIVSGWSGL
jgi:DNA-binding NtrC family response regulator